MEDFTGNHPWSVDYGLFLALKEHYQDKPWYAWPDELRQRQLPALVKAKEEQRARIDYFLFEQYLFFTQWQLLHEYAQSNNIVIIGDLPIYVALDSADVWANQDLFQLDQERGKPTHVAGVPPDYFSATGQRWGNPLYRWSTRYGTD